MNRILRGHHLLCVHGFKGMGYSPDFVHNMDRIVKNIRNDSIDFTITVVAAFDDACLACPNRGETECEAGAGSNEHVLGMDEKVIRHLGLEPGKSYKKSELLALTAEKVEPSDLDYLCARCSWLSQGVCKEGIVQLKTKMKELAKKE